MMRLRHTKASIDRHSYKDSVFIPLDALLLFSLCCFSAHSPFYLFFCTEENSVGIKQSYTENVLRNYLNAKDELNTSSDILAQGPYFRNVYGAECLGSK
jgi:hypothetical protein